MQIAITNSIDAFDDATCNNAFFFEAIKVAVNRRGANFLMSGSEGFGYVFDSDKRALMQANAIENQFFLFSFILSRRRHPASPSQGLGAKMKTILILWNTERESTNLRKFLKFKKDED